MDFIKTKIDGVVIVEPKVFGDHRGFFMESYSKREFEKAGLILRLRAGQPFLLYGEGDSPGPPFPEG